MKNYLLLFAIILLNITLATAQKAAPAKKKPATPAKAAAPVKPVVAAKPAAPPKLAGSVNTAPLAVDKPFPSRTDKFDPTRDPAADLKAASAKAQAEGKRIILDVGGEWCSWCHFLDSFFARNAELAKLQEENFIWLKINMSQENENPAFLSAYPAIEGYPHLFVMEKDGSFLHSQPTNVLELGKSYNVEKVTEFLTKWSPPKAETGK